jgi:F-type H+-transporting ATPase subunit a
MLAGHIILKVIAGFIVGMGAFGIIPFGFLFLMTGFEIFIAFLHAYIFTLLSCIYLNDAVNMH